MRTGRGIFVTGTHTGVGKTLVAAALLRLAARHGVRALGLKPVASGAVRTGPGGALRNADALELQAASAVAAAYETVNPCCFEPAIAPHLAAAEAGVAVELATLLAWYAETSRLAEWCVVEGAGGWRTPLGRGAFLSDLPEALGLDVVLVVGLTLGCLNHARLTFEAIERAGRCRFRGWIGNAVDPGFERPDENVATLAELLGEPPLALVPGLATAPRGPTGWPTFEFADDPRLLAALGIDP